MGKCGRSRLLWTSTMNDTGVTQKIVREAKLAGEHSTPRNVELWIGWFMSYFGAWNIHKQKPRSVSSGALRTYAR